MATKHIGVKRDRNEIAVQRLERHKPPLRRDRRNTRAGLASYLYTKDLDRSIRVLERLEYGMAGLNTGIISTKVAPFGGIKESGVGREGFHHGMDDYVELKMICTTVKLRIGRWWAAI